jgi:hypothetical protein
VTVTKTTTLPTTSLLIKFAGWFQCRLATDPDPTDEPRGVDGYIHAVPGEPDLDRIIRLQPTYGIVQRSYCPIIGVKVVSVYVDNDKLEDHPLVDALVDFLDNPKFEGRNNILARPGEEAVFPLHIQIKKNKCLIQRNFDDDIRFPPLNQDDRDKFRNLQATGLNINPGAIEDATGIFDLTGVWNKRITRLQSDLAKTSNEIEIAAINSRIKSMSNTAITRIFSARMLYSASLTGTAIFEDIDGYFPGKPIGLGPKDPWTLEFWFGAWDADAQSGYTIGYLGIPISSSKQKVTQVTDASNLIKDLSDMVSNPLMRRL